MTAAPFPFVLLATLVCIVVAGLQNARAEDGQVTPVLHAAEPQLLAPLSLPALEKLQPFEVRTTDSSLRELARWLSANFELPYADELPRIERVTPLRLYQLRHRAFLSSQGGSGASTAVPGYQREVVAVYDDATRTVYLPEGGTGASVAEQSVLVHEMVHHLQNIAGLKFACGGEREKPAYLAQDKWLKQHGLELEKEFEIDMFTVVALSACMG